MEFSFLLDFSCLFDTDYGTNAYLISKSTNAIFFEDGYDKWTDFFLKCKVLTRPDINPICILKKEYEPSQKKIYEDLLIKKYKDILRISPQTDIVKLVYKIYQNDKSISVLCKNQEEVDHINKYTTWKTVIYEDKMSIEDYNCLFFHDLDNSLKNFATQLLGKTIYIYYHKPNFLNYREKVPNISLMPFIGGNEVKIIPPYADFDIPKDISINDMEVTHNGKVYSIK